LSGVPDLLQQWSDENTVSRLHAPFSFAPLGNKIITSGSHSTLSEVFLTRQINRQSLLPVGNFENSKVLSSLDGATVVVIPAVGTIASVYHSATRSSRSIDLRDASIAWQLSPSGRLLAGGNVAGSAVK